MGSTSPIRKAPSLSTFTVPTTSAMPPPSQKLISALTDLIGQLPRENHDLLKTVIELMKATAKESKTTKMPLGNLLLVFCPSLSMTPPLLRALCESENIWDDELDTVLDIKRQTIMPNRQINVAATVPPSVPPPAPPLYKTPVDKVSQAALITALIDGKIPPAPPIVRKSSSQDYEEIFTDASDHLEDDQDEVPPARPRPPKTHNKAPSSVLEDDDDSIAEGYNRNTIHARKPSSAASYDVPSLRDDASYVSTSEGNSSSLNHTNTPSPAFSLSSVESLATPAGSSGAPSYAHLPLDQEQDPDSKLMPIQHHMDLPGSTPLIKKKISGKLATGGHMPISSPIIFPGAASSSSGSSPDSPLPGSRGGFVPIGSSRNQPVPPSPMSKRHSNPTLSLPNINSCAETATTPDSIAASLSKRLKRPSLHLLFSKRSSSSLTSSTANKTGSNTLIISSPIINHGPYIQTPRSAASDSSLSTPISAVTAPQASTFMLPPKLDTPPDLNQDFGLGFGTLVKDNGESERQKSEKGKEIENTVGSTSRLGDEPKGANANGNQATPNSGLGLDISGSGSYSSLTSNSLLKSKTPSPQSSPLRNVTDEVVTASITVPVAKIQPLSIKKAIPGTTLRAQPGRSGLNPVDRLRLSSDAEPEEDWTQSVLLAAGGDFAWSSSGSSSK